MGSLEIRKIKDKFVKTGKLGKRDESKIFQFIRKSRSTSRTLNTFYQALNSKKKKMVPFLTALIAGKKDITKKSTTNKTTYQADFIMNIKKQNSNENYDVQSRMRSNVFGMIARDTEIPREIFLDEIMPMIIANKDKQDNALIYAKVMRLLSGLNYVKISNVKEVKMTKPTKHGEIILENQRKRYVPNHFLGFNVNKNATKLEEIVDDTPFSHEYVNALVKKYSLHKSCLFLLMLDTFKTGFEAYKKKCKQPNFKMTAEWLYQELFGKEWDFKDVSISFNQVLPFFQKYKLGIYCLNTCNEVFFQYWPEKLNSNIKPKVMKAIYDDKHVYRLPNHVLVQQMIKKSECQEVNGELSRYYKISDTVKRRDMVVCKNEEELLQKIQTESGDLNVIYEGDMEEVLKALYNNTYLNKPSISCCSDDGLKIESININNLQGELTSIHIQKALKNMFCEETKGYNEKYYALFDELKDFYKGMYVNKQNMSFYNNDHKKTFTDYMPAIAKGCSEQIIEEMHSFDINKFYFYNLMNLPFLPVCTPFEEWQEYDGEIKDEYMYLCWTDETSMLFPKSTFAAFGYNLKKYGIKYEIKQQMQFYEKDNVGAQYLNNIYDSDLKPEHKKLIPNVICGIIGKKTNKDMQCYLFNNANDAAECEYEKGGKQYQIATDLYVVIKRSTGEHLENGFLPIRFLLLDMCRAMMCEKKTFLEEKGYKVVGMNTDALFVEKLLPNHEELLSNQYGGFKLECKQMPSRIWMEKEDRSKHVFASSDNMKQKVQFVINEYSEAEIFARVENKTLFYGVGGSGKSRSAFNYAIKKFGKDKVLSVSFTNSVGIKNKAEYGVNAITLHGLLGLGKNDKQIAGKNIDDYECIVIDEIYMLDLKLVMKLFYFMQRHNKFWLATGDPRQLYIDGEDERTRINRYISKLFTNRIDLKVNKRCDEKSRVILERIIHRLFDKLENPTDVLRETLGNKIIKDIGNIKRGFSYYNTSRRAINKLYNAKLSGKTHINGYKYEVGMNLICKHTLKQKNGKLYNNNVYKVVDIGKKFVLEDCLSNETYEVNSDAVYKFFEMENVRTVHSGQGYSIDEAYFLVDWKSKFITKEWVNVAITRCRNLDNVYLLDKTFYEPKDMQIFTSMVIGYHSQDEKKGRDIVNFVNADYIKILYYKNKKCCHCGQDMVLESGGNQFTLNRLNNDLCHSKTNVEGCCLDCNRRLR